MMYQVSKLREKYERGEYFYGVNSTFIDPTVTELFGFAGYDYVWIDAEHSALDYHHIQQHIMAAHSAGCFAFVRLMEVSDALTKRIMDMGADGLIFPLVKSVEDVKRAIAGTRFPPKGVRGWNPLRAIEYGSTDHDWFIENADRNVWKMFMIEQIEAVDCLDEICALEGVDALIVGQSDLSASMGKLHQFDDPEVNAALDRICPIAKKHKVPVGISCGVDPQVMRRWLERGIDFISVGQDANMLSSIARDYLKKAKTAYEEFIQSQK